MLFCSHRAFTTTLLTLGLVLSTTCSKAAAEPPEATYLAERDRWFQQFAQAAEAPDDAQQQALEALTQALLGALTPHPGPITT